MNRAPARPKRSTTPTSATFPSASDQPPSSPQPQSNGGSSGAKPLYLCSPFVDAALVTGNFKTIVMLPKYVDVMEWVACNGPPYSSVMEILLILTYHQSSTFTRISTCSMAWYPSVARNKHVLQCLRDHRQCRSLNVVSLETLRSRCNIPADSIIPGSTRIASMFSSQHQHTLIM